MIIKISKKRIKRYLKESDIGCVYYHNDYGPAFFRPNVPLSKHIEYRQNNKEHNRFGPAVIYEHEYYREEYYFIEGWKIEKKYWEMERFNY